MTLEVSHPVLHVSAWREDHGGIQSTLRHHHERDADLGFAPAFVSVFDRTVTWPGACASLGADGWMSLKRVAAKFSATVPPVREGLVVYHDGWGLEWLAPHDRAGRRLVYLHTERPHTDALLRRFDGAVDGFLTVSRGFAARVRRVLPEFPAERICPLPFFVEPPPWIANRPPRDRSGRTLRLGYAGRVERGHKRLDRLPDLVAALDRHGLDFQFEVLGDGAYLPELKRRVAGDARIVFSGWRSGEAYWRTIAEWDAVVLLSDFEGFSRVTMECMCGGVLPVHPDFSPAASELLGPAAAHGLYPTGDMAAAAGRIAALAGLTPEAGRDLRRQCADHLAAHTAARYDETYAGFLRRVAELPRRSVAPCPSALTQWLPLGVYTRLFPRRF